MADTPRIERLVSPASDQPRPLRIIRDGLKAEPPIVRFADHTQLLLPWRDSSLWLG
jgi:hypothetical protein